MPNEPENTRWESKNSMRTNTFDRFGTASDTLVLEDQPMPEPIYEEALVVLETDRINSTNVRARAGGRPGITNPLFPKIIPHSNIADLAESVRDDFPNCRISPNTDWTLAEIVRNNIIRCIPKFKHS